MAGSYNHIIDEKGKYIDDEFVDMIENLGDAKEMAEELLLMIYFLSNGKQDRIKDALTFARSKIREDWEDKFVFYREKEN